MEKKSKCLHKKGGNYSGIHQELILNTKTIHFRITIFIKKDQYLPFITGKNSSPLAIPDHSIPFYHWTVFSLLYAKGITINLLLRIADVLDTGVNELMMKKNHI